MIFPDVNVLLYAYDESSDFHAASAKWLKHVLLVEQVYFSWHTITGFLRILTNPRSSTNPLTIETAVRIVDGWLQLDNTHLVGLEKRNWPIFSSILVEGQATGNLVMDAHVAATAVSCGATVASTDRDFSRFGGVRTINPISRPSTATV